MTTGRSLVMVCGAIALAGLAGVGLCACKGKAQRAGGGQAGPRDGGAAARVDAGGAAAAADAGLADPDDAPDEMTLRQGKRTGLGAPAELPEVATEDLIEALVKGTVPWSRFVDPARGVVELKLPGPGGAGTGPAGAVTRRCGTALAASFDALTRAMTEAGTSGLGYALDCDNAGLFVPDPDGAAPSATCSMESEAAGTIIVDLVFVPDPALGLRLTGVSTMPADEDVNAETALPAFEQEMADAAGKCPP
ncbi:MAG TPA: hypothetical protein VHE35_25050 [Kofleriaceae bacterium]|nr:hypothetical protein [Kofleriaceae bacterium]